MADEHKSLKQIIEFRREKLEKLRTAGVDPYPHTFKPDTQSEAILGSYDTFEGKTVTLAGRIMSLRKMGKASFFHLQDSHGKIQIFIRRDDVGEEIYDQFKLLDLGDFVGVTGYVFKTKTGEITIHTDALTILCKSIRPLPVVKEKDGSVFDAFSDKEMRYRNRHLDLILNPQVRETFVKRAKIIAHVRAFLDERGFLEVETPVLQPLYGGANARPFTTYHNALDQTLYLRIADELYLKRLIIGGFGKVYELSKDFRNEGMDRNHNPEFTMLEWYEAYTDYEDQMEQVELLVRSTAEMMNKLQLNWGGMDIDLSKPFSRCPILDLLEDATGKDLSQADEAELKSLCKTKHVDVPKDANYGILLDKIMSQLVEPELIQPTFVTDYPRAISPLAKRHRSKGPDLVERFELFIGGAEFANAFTELNDPIDQRNRFESQARLKEKGDEEAHPVDENFLQAMECGMPPTGGVGLGIDRLVMLLTENRWIKDVILFPVLRSEDK
jgi:lysyl-tRNA synthetase class 2